VAEPVSLLHAAFACRCPRCGQGRLFKGLLEIRPRCEVCDLDLSTHDAGDGAAVGVILVLGAMGNLQQFDVIYAMTGGGPVRATTMLSLEVRRQAFETWNIGLAAAVGLIWFLTIAGPAYVYLRSLFRSA